MKRRILNFLLLAVMLVVGMSAKAATTVGNTDNTSAWWTAWSDYQTIPANSTLHMEFTNYTCTAAQCSDNSWEDGTWKNYYSWVLVATNKQAHSAAEDAAYSEYFAVRSDNFGWGTFYDASGNSSNWDWDNYRTIMDGAHVKMDVIRSGAKVTVNFDVAGGDGKSYFQKYVMYIGEAEADIVTFLAVNRSHFEIDDAKTVVYALSDAVPVADFDFSTPIADSKIVGNVNTMTIGTGGAATYIDADGCLRPGDHTNVISIPAEQRPGANGKTEVSFKMAFGNKNNMGSGFRFKDAEGNEIASFQFARWDGSGKNANTLDIDMAGLYAGHYGNKPLTGRYTEFVIDLDYKKGVIASTVSCPYNTASKDFEVKLANRNPIASVEFFGYGVGDNTDRANSLDDVKITTIQKPAAEEFFSESYTSASTTDGWTSATGGRFTPAILSEGDDYFMSVNQGQRNNNGTTVTGTILQDKVAAGENFTLEFDMRLSSSSNQTATAFTVYDAANTGIMLSLKETGTWATTWILNGTETTVTLPNSNKANVSNSISDVTWCSYKLIRNGKKTYLTIVNKETGDYILNRVEVEGTSVTGGLGKMTFVTSRYLANFAIDNIKVHEVADEDLEPAVTMSEPYTSASTTDGWTSATGGRFTPVILSEGDNYFLSVNQSQRNNNGTTVTGTILQDKAAAGEDFTLEFDMRLSSSSNQTATAFTLYDAANTGIMLSLKETGTWATTWILNGTETTVTLPNSNKANVSNSIADVPWYSYKLTRSGKTTYLTITNKATGAPILERTKVNASVSAAGGLGKMTFVTSRYLANFAIDNIVVRGVAPRDLPDAMPATYTVKFVDELNNTLKADVLHEEELLVNDEAVANEEEMHLFDVGGTRYIYTKSDTIILSDTPEDNIIKAVFHQAQYYDWKVVGKYDQPTNVFDIESGNALEGDTLEVTYRQFHIDDASIAYKAAAQADGRCVYRFPIVQQETVATMQVDTVYYTKVGPVEIVEEVEDAPGLTVVANEKCSGGAYAYNATDDFVQITTEVLTPGTYKMTVGTFDELKGDGKTLSGDWFVFNAVPRGSVIPTTEADRLTPATYSVGTMERDITIYTPAYIYLKGGENGVGIDYIMITRTGDLNEASGYVSVPDSLTGDAVTEMETINSADFDVYVSPSQFVEIDGKRYLQMENGTITVQCTTGRAVKDVKFIGLPEGYTWDYATADLGTIDSLHWTMQEGFDKVIFTFTKPSLIAGISVGGYLPGQAKVYYKNDYEEAASTTGWTSSVAGRYTPVILDQDGNHYLSVDQDSRYNNGAVVTGSVLKGALPEDVTDFTLEFDMRLGGTNQQFSNLQFQDAQGKAMLKLTLTAASSTVWSINDKADMTLDLKNSGYTSGGRNISTIDWYSYQLSHKDGLNYLTVTHKESGEKIYDMEPLESDAVDGGMGNIVFTSARYFANIAFDNIVLRELLPSDVPNVTISQYTIKYVAEDGAILHDDITTNAIVGTKVAANAEQIAPIVIDEKKYIYASGNDSLLITDDAAANILTLNFRVAKVFNYTARGTSGEGILGVFERGTGNEGDVVTVAYPRYVLDKKGRLWTRDAENSQYRTTATLTKDKQMINLAYDLPAEAIENVIFYSEGENLPDALKSNAANTVIRSSNAGAGFYTEDTKILTLKPGSYTITAVGFFGASAGGSIKFTDGTQTLFMVSSAGASNGTGATGEIELTEVTPIYLAAGSNTVCLDYFYIQTEDGGIATDGIADVKAGYEQGAVYNLKGQKVADSLEGLQPGLYLVNGKKVTVK